MESAPGPYSNLDRPRLSEAVLTRAVLGGQSRWSEVRVVASTGSTNADLVTAALAGDRAEKVLVAEEQTSGRGRLDRGWASPPRSGLTFSMLVVPHWPITEWGWVPLAAGVALVEAVRASCELDDAGVKWPNDLLVGERKCAGVLAEIAGDTVVVGIGLNVTTRADELPDGAVGAAAPTSLLLEGAATTDRGTLLLSILRRFDHLLSNDAAAVRERLQEVCSTIGAQVRVELPGDATVEGTAVDVDHDGRLVVETDEGRRHFAAGDVRHIRRTL